MARCPHSRTQQFTEICLDCYRNTYELDKEYLNDLLKYKDKRTKLAAKIRKKANIKENSDEQISLEIEALEIELGIYHPGNTQQLGKCDS